MCDPVKDGVAKAVEFVVYTEVPPPSELSEMVHCFWELKSLTTLDEDFTLHAMPDACVNLLFNQDDARIAGVTQLQTSHTALDRGPLRRLQTVDHLVAWRGRITCESSTDRRDPGAARQPRVPRQR